MASDERTPRRTLLPAFRSYATRDPAAPEGETLNLAWTRDERPWLAVDLTERRPMRAANIVGHDLEAGDRVRMSGLREEQVAVLLVRVGLLSALLHPDHPAPHRPGRVA